MFKRLLPLAVLAAAGYGAQPASAATAFGGHYYEYVRGIITWQGALAAAATHAPMAGYTAHLVTITSKAEDDFLKTLIGPDYFVWAAASDAETEGVWKWVAGPEAGQVFFNQGGPAIGFTNWNPNEPNNLGDEDFLHISANFERNWNDVDAEWRSGGYIVEYSLITNGVPEPSSWAMLIAGFGLVGVVRRRRRVAVAT